MRRLNYLNVILTVLAIVLSALLWVEVVDRVQLAPVAEAGPPPGIPDAGQQRLQMVKELQKLNKAFSQMAGGFEDSEFKVEVISMPPVEIKD